MESTKGKEKDILEIYKLEEDERRNGINKRKRARKRTKENK